MFLPAISLTISSQAQKMLFTSPKHIIKASVQSINSLACKSDKILTYKPLIPGTTENNKKDVVLLTLEVTVLF